MVTQAQIEHSRSGRQHVKVDHIGQEHTKTNTYLTPIPLLEVVYQCLGRVDLDPCSNSQTSPQVVADTYYTEHEDVLVWPWYGRVFCNPPYKTVGKWTTKFIAEYQIGHMKVGIYLVAASTETK